MRRLMIIVVLLLTIFFACKRTKPQIQPSVDNNRWQFEMLDVDKELFLDNDSTKKGMNFKLEFNFPSAYKNDSILKAIQSSFILAFAGDGYEGKTPKESFDIFEKKSVEESLKIGELAVDDDSDFSHYFKSITTTVFDTTATMITAKTAYKDYMGGAHGSDLTLYYNIALNDGSILNEKDLFRKNFEKQLADLIKIELTNLINTGNPVTVFGLDNVKPNGNYYFDKKGMVYVFNRGEIAPYSDGAIELCIPYSNIKNLIKPEFEESIIRERIKTE